MSSRWQRNWSKTNPITTSYASALQFHSFCFYFWCAEAVWQIPFWGQASLGRMYIKKLWRVHNLLNPTHYWKLLADNPFNRNHWWRKWLLFWSDRISYGVIFLVCNDLPNLEQHAYSLNSACCKKTDTYVLLFINGSGFTFLLCSVTNTLSKFSVKWLNNWIEKLYPSVHNGWK